MAAAKEKEESSSLSVFLIERTQVSNPEAQGIMENSAECWNVTHSSKDDGEGSLEKETQVANLHGNFSVNGSEREQAEISKACCISAGHCVNWETMDEVKDHSVEKSERRISSNAFKLSGWLSTDFASPSENVSEEMKAASNAIDESAVFTTPERNLMFMEQLSENGKICAAQSVTHHNDEAVQSDADVFTTPEKVLLKGDSELDEAEKEEVHTATKFPDESDVLNATEECFMSGGSRQNEARNEGESIVVKLPGESNIATSPVRQSSVEDFKRDGIERNEENRTVEYSCDFGTCSSPDRNILLTSLVSDGAEDSGGSPKTAAEFHDGSAVPNIDELSSHLQVSGTCSMVSADKFVEAANLTKNTQTTFEGNLLLDSSVPEKTSVLAGLEDEHFGFDSEVDIEKTCEKSGHISLGNEATDPIATTAFEEAISLTPDESTVQNNMFEEAAETTPSPEDEGMKGDNIITAKDQSIKRDSERDEAAFCEESLVFTSPERRLLLGNSEPHNVGNGKQERIEDKSTFFIRLENRLLLGESGHDRLDIGKSDISHYASSPKVILMENTVVRGSHVAALEFTENTNSTALKGNNEADKHVEATVTKNTQIDYEGNLLLDSSGTIVSKNTCVLAGTKDEHSSFESEEDFNNTSEKSGHKALEDEESGPIATAIAADEEVIRRETTPTPEETMKKYSNTDESGIFSEKQVEREQLLIYGTQVKPNTNNMKENAPNSKIVHNLNITAPRISKRKPLQDLKNN